MPVLNEELQRRMAHIFFLQFSLGNKSLYVRMIAREYETVFMYDYVICSLLLKETRRVIYQGNSF
jgi:hypothetical protein